MEIISLKNTKRKMSRSIIKNKFGQEFPKQNPKGTRHFNGIVKKFFGWREGDATSPNAIKGVDFINYGYPSERRHKSVIKQKIQDNIDKEDIV